MRKMNLFITAILVFAALVVTAQPDPSMPSEIGKCYAKCLIQDQYETVTEQVLVKEASSKVSVINAQHEVSTEQVMKVEAATRISVAPAQFETMSEEVLAKEAATTLSVNPAQFETMSEEVLVKEAGKSLSFNPAQFETVSETVLVKEGTTSLRAVPARWETATEEVLAKEAYSTLKVIPARWETVTEEVLVQEAGSTIKTFPPQYETVTEEILSKEAYSTVSKSAPVTDYAGLMSMLDNGGNAYTGSNGQTISFDASTMDNIRSLKGMSSNGNGVGNVRLTADKYGNVYATLSEEVLLKEAYSTMTTSPARYETLTEEVLSKEAYSTMSSSPAVYETATEEVLVKEAYTVIERKPVKYTTETITMETKPASTKWVKKKADKNCLSADPNDCLVWCLVEQPAQFKTVTKQVKMGCDEGWTLSGDDCTREVAVPAKYGQRTFKVLAKPASTNSVTVPAKYETRSYQKMVTPAASNSVTIPAVYETRTYQKMIIPASSATVTIPAVYTTRSYQKLASPARSETVEIPARYETRSYQKIVSPASTEVTEIPAQYTTRTYKTLASAASVEEVGCGGSNKVILENINFQTASAVLTQSSYAEIANLESMLKNQPNMTAKVVGHTDSDGSSESNQVLSKNRAKAVYTVLIEAGISNGRLSFEGMGEIQPIASNATSSGKRQNRRTEFITFGGTISETVDCNKYGSVSHQKLTNDASVSSSDIPAQYTSRKYTTLAADASISSEDIEAVYEVRSFNTLASPASVQQSNIDPVYTTVSKTQLVKSGGFTEWREVVCESDVTPNLYRSVQQALIERGYSVGSADGVFGSRSKSALVKFQKDNGLPVGSLDFETLRALGVR